jgi:predicted RNA-binding Zn-ribbon protein involved in translation (DUF1610 family)
MFGDGLVEWSVAECNRQNAGRTKAMGMACPDCGKDDWQVHHGIDPEFRSQYNPGEYVDFVCVHCGYTDHQAC